MLLEIISKITSESLLSLYPVFVKNIGLPLHIQTWSRLFSYVAVSLFFIDSGFAYKTMMTGKGLLLSFVTLAHIYTSYRGFQLLDSGVAYSIFYLYPIMILLLSGYKITPVMGLALLGVYMLASKDSAVDTESFDKKMEKNDDKYKDKYKEKNETFPNEGLIMIVLAAFTEAIIYFLVKDIKTFNNWNHIFISYFPGLFFMTYVFQTDILRMFSNFRMISFSNVDVAQANSHTRLLWSFLINGGIGLFGYLLRFFAVSRLDTVLYAVLSYFGIVMSFIYGILFNGETVSLKKIVGAFLIMFANWWLL